MMRVNKANRHDMHTIKNNIMPDPAYSLYDLWRDIDRGNVNTFNHDGETFTVTHRFRKTVTRDKTGQTAHCGFYMGAMLDYQGVAAYLMTHNGDVMFDQDGNVTD